MTPYLTLTSSGSDAPTEGPTRRAETREIQRDKGFRREGRTTGCAPSLMKTWPNRRFSLGRRLVRLPAAECSVLGPPGYAELRLLPAGDAQGVVLVEVLVVLEVQGGERDVMGQAAGRNPHVVDRPRAPAPDGCRGQPSPDGGYCLLAGHGSTARRDSQPVSSSRRRWPQLRISAHLASSPKVTKVISGSRPIRRVASGPASASLCSREATSVSKTAGSTAEDQAQSR